MSACRHTNNMQPHILIFFLGRDSLKRYLLVCSSLVSGEECACGRAWRSTVGRTGLRICMRREAPLGGVCLACLTLSDSRQVGSRNPLSWRKRLMSFIDHRLIQRVETLGKRKIKKNKQLLLTSGLQQVR